MTKRTVTALSGLDTRSAALFVQTASKFKSKIQLQIDDKYVNAKSIMGIISLGVLNGHVISVVAEGEDEDSAVSELTSILQDSVRE